MQSWLQISLEVDADEADAVATEFVQLGASGAWEEPLAHARVLLRACFPTASGRWREAVRNMGATRSWQPGRDWNAEFRSSLNPLEVVPGLWIVPTHHAPFASPGPQLVLDPGMAFGTGQHETTRLALELLAQEDPRGKTVLDVGCGTGILMMAAHRWGAHRIVGLDNDPDAVTVARDNCRTNRIAGEVLCGDLSAGTGHFDIVVANILAVVLDPMMSHLLARTAPQGTLIVSGLLHHETAVLEARARSCGARCTARAQEGSWSALALRRSERR
jgi:ribosomal protein L11 methyltransferase